MDFDIGEELARERRASGISQRELGKRIGVRQQQIARWEATGYAAAEFSRVTRVAQALGLHLQAVSDIPIAAEASATYAASSPATSPSTNPHTTPVRDLGEIAARIRAHGDVLRNRFHIGQIGVFGSFVHGEQTPSSDVDLLVEFIERPTGFAYFEPALYLEEILGRAVDVSEEHTLHERLRPRVMKDTVYVWQA